MVPPRVNFPEKTARAGLAGFVWGSVSVADRDLVFQDTEARFSWRFAPAVLT
jgi:hypothetical protein